MRRTPLLSLLAAAASLLAVQVHAASFTYTGTLADCPLAGTNFAGRFAFNEVAPAFTGEAPLTAFSMVLGSAAYTLATADTPASAVFDAGSFIGLAYTDADSDNLALKPWVSFVPGFTQFSDAYLAYISLPVAGADSGFGSYSVAVVPEPASVAMLLAGLASVAALVARRTRRPIG